MQRLWANVNTGKYFTYFAAIVFAAVKLLFDYFRTNEIFLQIIHAVKPTIISFYIISLIYVGLFLLTIVVIKLRFDKSFDKWQEDNKGKPIEQLLNKIFNESLLAWAMFIAINGFYIFLTLTVFSWPEFLIFFGIIIIRKVIKTVYDSRKAKTQKV